MASTKYSLCGSRLYNSSNGTLAGEDESYSTPPGYPAFTVFILCTAIETSSKTAGGNCQFKLQWDIKDQGSYEDVEVIGSDYIRFDGMGPLTDGDTFTETASGCTPSAGQNYQEDESYETEGTNPYVDLLANEWTAIKWQIANYSSGGLGQDFEFRLWDITSNCEVAESPCWIRLSGGTDTSNRKIRTSGHVSATPDTSNRPVRTHGSEEDTSNRPVRIHGSEEDNSDRDIRVHGHEEDDSNRPIRVPGHEEDTSYRALRTNGEVAGGTDNDNRAIRIHGSEEDDSDRDIRIHGHEEDDDSRKVRTWGLDTDDDNRKTRIWGHETDSSDRDIRTHGHGADNSSRFIRIRGFSSDTGNRAIRAYGHEQDVSNRALRTYGHIVDFGSIQIRTAGYSDTPEEYEVLYSEIRNLVRWMSKDVEGLKITDNLLGHYIIDGQRFITRRLKLPEFYQEMDMTYTADATSVTLPDTVGWFFAVEIDDDGDRTVVPIVAADDKVKQANQSSGTYYCYLVGRDLYVRTSGDPPGSELSLKLFGIPILAQPADFSWTVNDGIGVTDNTIPDHFRELLIQYLMWKLRIATATKEEHFVLGRTWKFEFMDTLNMYMAERDGVGRRDTRYTTFGKDVLS